MSPDNAPWTRTPAKEAAVREAKKRKEHETKVAEANASAPWKKKKQLKGVVAFRMPVNRLEGKFKLGQNRAPEDVLAAVKGLRAAGNTDAEMVAAEMEARAQKG